MSNKVLGTWDGLGAQDVGTRYPSKPFAYQGSVLRIKLVPLERESRELDGVHFGVDERLRNADLVNEQPAWHRLVQVHGIQRFSILVVLDFQYLERNCNKTTFTGLG